MVRNLHCQLNVRALTAGSHHGALQGAAAVGLYKDPSTSSVQQICPDRLPARVECSGVPQEPLLHAQ